MADPVIYSMRFQFAPLASLLIPFDGRPQVSSQSAPISKAEWVDIEVGDWIRVKDKYHEVIGVFVYRSHPVEDENRPVQSGRHWLHEKRGEPAPVCRRPY